MPEASNADSLQDLSRSWRQSLAERDLPPVAPAAGPDNEPASPVDSSPSESAGQPDPDATPMPEEPVVAQTSTTTRVTKPRTKATR